MRINFDRLLRRQTAGGFKGTQLDGALDRLPCVSSVGPWLAGGAVRRTLLGTSLAESDYDFFFRTQQQYDDFCEWMIDIHALKIAETPLQTTWTVFADEPASGQLPLKVQAIRVAFYESPEALLDTFDFTICQLVYDGTDLICGEYALWDLGRKLLVPHRVSFGVATLRRIIKYTKQGFYICGGGLGNILEQVVASPDIIRAETLSID